MEQPFDLTEPYGPPGFSNVTTTSPLVMTWKNHNDSRSTNRADVPKVPWEHVRHHLLLAEQDTPASETECPQGSQCNDTWGRHVREMHQSIVAQSDTEAGDAALTDMMWSFLHGQRRGGQTIRFLKSVTEEGSAYAWRA